MPKMKREELAQYATDLRNRASLLSIALQCATTERPDAKVRYRVPDDDFPETVILRAYRLTGPHGGIVVSESRIAGQRPDVHAYYLDDMVSARAKDYAKRTLPFRCALGELTRIRESLLDRQATA